jgi:hypothetical protein
MIYKSQHRRPYREMLEERDPRERIMRDTRRKAIAAKRVWLES